jgi:hypothetical protein
VPSGERPTPPKSANIPPPFAEGTSRAAFRMKVRRDVTGAAVTGVNKPAASPIPTINQHRAGEVLQDDAARMTREAHRLE